MFFLKITNLLVYGNPDYKGLDINKFVPGSQVYDLEVGICYVKTDEIVIPQHSDIAILDEANYILETDIIKNKAKAEVQSIQDRISAVEIGLAQVLGI